jgi:hypothetical protein
VERNTGKDPRNLLLYQNLLTGKILKPNFENLKNYLLLYFLWIKNTYVLWYVKFSDISH